MSKKSKSMTVVLSSEIVEILQELAAYYGTSLTDQIRHAVSDRKFFSDAYHAGKDIILVKDRENTHVEWR